MDIFSLVGRITVNYADAVKDIDKVSDAADNAADNLDGMGDAARGAEGPVEDSGNAARDAEGKFSAWKMTLANLAADVIQRLVSKCADLAKSVVETGMNFSSAMSEVQAISGATDEQMAMLEVTAREFGKSTKFSATEAAEALKYMALAGWSAEESTEALGGVLDLAAASGMELGQASDMVTDYLSAFGMEADRASYFADILAYAQANSNTSAEQLGEAYRNCAANLNAAGQDVETTTSLLEAMANQGYKGSEAGTALAAIMRDITNAMDDGKIKIGDTTVAVTDANGNFQDLTDILKEVETATNGMGDAERAAALSSTFTADSTKGLNLVLNEGMEQVAGYEEALRNADGAATDMAATMNDNLQGDLANMHSAFDELKLKIFDGAESPLRGFVQFVTNSVVPGLTALIENFDKIAPVLAGGTAALVTFKAAMAISGIIDTATTAFKTYQAVNEGATVAQWLMNDAILANPIVLIVTLIAGLVAAILVLWNTNEDFRNGVIAAWEAVKSAFGTAISAIAGFFGGLVDGISTALSTAWGVISAAFAAIVQAFQGVWETVSGIFDLVVGIFTGVWESVTSIFRSIVETVSVAWETVKNVVQVALMFLVELITAAFELITLPFRFIWENCKETILAAWETMKTIVTAALDVISAKISSVWNTIVSFLVPLLEGLKNTFTIIWNTILSVIETIVNTIKTTVTDVWNAILAIVSTVMNTISSIVSSIWNAILSAVSSRINTIREVISSVFNGIKSTISGILSTIAGLFSSAWDGIKAIVAGAINGVSSKISDGLEGARNIVTGVLDAIREKFSSIFESAKSIVSGAIDKIQSYFNFSWSLPKIKLPHFTISGKFSLDPPSIPHFGVEWYKKAMDGGMIMNRPTVFGYNPKSNQLMAGGEAGSETVVGTVSLMDMIRTAVTDENAAIAEKLEQLISICLMYFPQMANLQMVTDTGVLIGELAPGITHAVKREISREQQSTRSRKGK